MNAGGYNKRITFQYHVEGVTDEGFPIDKWDDFKTVYAKVKNVSAREFYKAASIQNEYTARFTIRYSAGRNIHEEMQIKYGSKTYTIDSIINDGETNETFTIMGRELRKDVN